jgi:hypothetical protein
VIPVTAGVAYIDESGKGVNSEGSPEQGLAHVSDRKLAVAGEQAGLSVEQMIRLLNDGLAVETLLELIPWVLSWPVLI